MSYDDKKIVDFINSSEGKAKLAQAMIAPIRRNLNYQGLSRQILNITQIQRYYYICY